MNDPLFKQQGYQLVGAAIEVHDEVGGGLLEEIYQECLELEFSRRGYPFRSKTQLEVRYKGELLKKRYVPDLVAFDGLIVELKSAAKILPEHEAQLMNYLRISNSRAGYLLNFGPIDGLEWKRFVI